jgi:parvulin-like peptidyl-prolyl isomerase
VPATGLSTVVDRIVAVVNDDIITLSELESTFHPYQKRIEATYRGADKDKVIAEGRIMVLNRMIDNSLIEQWSKKAGIVVKDDEAMDTIKDLLRRRNISMEAFTKTLEREGSSLEAYRQDMKEQMTRMRLLRRELKTKILVSDDEIGENYVKHRDEYEGKEAVRIKQILILLPPDADRTVKARLKADAEVIRQRLSDGESFDLLAAQFSQGPSAATGGDVGFLEKGTMLPEVDAVAFRLAKDEISEIIVSPVGLHIIKVLDKRGAGVKPIGIVREEIKAKLEEEKMEKSYEEWIVVLRKRSHIEIRL